MRAALDDAGRGNERELCLLLEFRDRQCAAVAHGGLDLRKRQRYVVAKTARVRDVGIDALLERQLLVAAEVVPLPVARTRGALAPVFLVISAVEIHLAGRAFVESRKVPAEHDKIRAHRKRQRHVVVIDDAAVGADRNVHARLLKVRVARLAHVDQRRRLTAADALRFTRDADGPAADADLDKVRALLRKEAETVRVDHVARADLHRVAVAFAYPRERSCLPFRKALGRVDADNVRARLNERRDAGLVVARVDARADDVALVIIQELVFVFLMGIIVLAEHDVAKLPHVVYDRQRVQLVIPDDVVRFF